MTDGLQTWDEINKTAWPTLLVGNGLSINVWSNFSYSRLLEQSGLNTAAVQLFRELGTANFESVLEALWHAERSLAALGRSTLAVTNLYQHVQQQLVEAVRQVHVAWQCLPPESLAQIAVALKDHQMVFTLNYDLLTYWAVMAGGELHSFGDFFWSDHNTFSLADCDLCPPRTALFYLHGGVHLWQDAATGRTGKWTRQSAGSLLARLSRNLDDFPNRHPLFVSEGTAAQKMAVIRRSDYLSFARRCLIDDDANTVIFGASFGTQDTHVVEALNAGPKRKIAISIWPGTHTQNYSTIARYRSKLTKHDLRFFDSRTHPLGDPKLKIK